MTIAEKITLGVAIAGVLGVGALLKSWVDHLLSRHERVATIAEKKATVAEKEATIAEKSVQMANLMMTRMDTELTRAQANLAERQQEVEKLRAELTEAKASSDAVSGRLADELLEAASANVAATGRIIDRMQREVHQAKNDMVSLEAATLAALQAFGILEDEEGGGAVPAVPSPRP